MLHRGYDNFVAGLDVVHRPAIGYKIDPLGRVARPYQALGALRVYEVRDLLPRLFIPPRGFHAESMHAAMNIRVVTLIVVHKRLNDLARLLSGRCRIKPYQRLAVIDLLGENRKVLSDLHHI